jgi:predicted phage terminase large subunit-like protein
MHLTAEEWPAIEREYCTRDLASFIRRAWPVIEPSSSYVHGWHIDALAEHLEAVTAGEISRLLINVPPGTMKSLAVGVLWPAWEWGPKRLPHYRYVGAAHAQDLAVRDNMRMRRLVKSEWYQALWPLALAADQDAKLKFENAATGFRAAVTATAMTGHRGDRVLYDDPHSVEGALSDVQRNAVLRVFAETVTTRLNSPEGSAIVVIMQRLHEQDLSGYILEQELGYEHLCLPMEFEPDRRCRTSIGFEDPRQTDGELLFPERFPAEVVERDKQAMGALAAARQYQQRPTPRGGGMFPTDRFVFVDHAPAADQIESSIRYWDKAGTHRASAASNATFTAGVLLHKLKDGRFCVAHVMRGQWGALDRERMIRQVADMDGRRIPIAVEQEPGSGGKESAEGTIRALAGWRVKADRPTGDKTLRAEPYAAQVQAGNVLVVRAEWNRDFIDEHVAFPVGRTKDQVDAAAAGFNLLTLKRDSRIDVPVEGVY